MSTDAYLRWKPVSYLSDKRERRTSVKSDVSTELENVTVETTGPTYASLLYAVLGNNTSSCTMKAANMTFGIAGDEQFYNTTSPPFMSW